jgi:hypothetical protein
MKLTELHPNDRICFVRFGDEVTAFVIEVLPDYDAVWVRFASDDVTVVKSKDVLRITEPAPVESAGNASHVGGKRMSI